MPLRWVLFATILTLIFGLVSPGARAQEGIEAGDRIRVGIPHPGGVYPFVGSMVSANQDSITLILENGRLFSTSLSNVRYVATSRGRPRLTLAQSAATGAGIAGAMTALTLFARTQLDSAAEPSSERPWLAIGMAAGAIPGAVAGLALGALLRRERWRRIPISTFQSGHFAEPPSVPAPDVNELRR